jgi:hypothetical protein
MVFPAPQAIFDVIGDLITNERQRKQLVLDDRIVGLLGKVPIQGRLAPHKVRPIMHAEQSTVELGAVTIHRSLHERTECVKLMYVRNLSTPLN